MEDLSGGAEGGKHAKAEGALQPRSAILRAVPNLLSLTRLALGLAFPFVPSRWRLVILAAAAVTEFLDGSLARVLGTTGGTGQILDPIADKTFMVAVLGTLVWDGALTLLQLVLVAARDLLVAAGALWVLATRGRAAWGRMPPSLLGKLATTAQLIFLLAVVITEKVNTPLFVITSVLSVLAGINYLMRGPSRAK